MKKAPIKVPSHLHTEPFGCNVRHRLGALTPAESNMGLRINLPNKAILPRISPYFQLPCTSDDFKERRRGKLNGPSCSRYSIKPFWRHAESTQLAIGFMEQHGEIHVNVHCYRQGGNARRIGFPDSQAFGPMLITARLLESRPARSLKSSQPLQVGQYILRLPGLETRIP